MIRDITIGQYYPSESVIHKLDPRVKFICTMLFVASMFCFHRFLGLFLATTFLFCVIKVSKVPLSYISRGLKPIAGILIFTMVIKILFSGGTPLFQLGVINISLEGIREAVFLGIRLCVLVFGASMMTFTTTPNQLTSGMERLFRPLKKFHVPVHEIAMMMSIALRFIPILLEETDKIIKAQAARGADFETGGLVKRAKSLVPILIPLFISAFRRANELAMAMEARCYRGGENRTQMKPLSYGKTDYMVYAGMLVYLVILFLCVNYMPPLWSLLVRA